MSRKTIVAIVGRIVTAIVIAALMGGGWWLWPRLRTGPAVDWDASYVGAMLVGSLALFLLAIWWLWWRLPQRQVRGLDIQIHDPKARADTEDNFRKTIGQALGGAAVLIGAGAAYLQFTQQQRAQQQATEISRKASNDLLISNQVAKGFEQLAGTEVAMRLGGIYGLEGVMNASPKYHQPVLEALCAFVRESTTHQQGTLPALLKALLTAPSVNATGKIDAATDVQAALTVIGRRNSGPGEVNLAGANIPSVNLMDAHLEDANLGKAHLEGAILDGVHLGRAYLGETHFEGAIVIGAHLEGANLIEAHLERTYLGGLHLEGRRPDGRAS